MRITSVFIFLFGSMALPMLTHAQKYIWAAQSTSAKMENVIGMDVDANDNIIVSGRHENSMLYNSGDASRSFIQLGREHYNCNFLVKYANTGALLWARDIYSLKNNSIPTYVHAQALDSKGNIYICGAISEPTVFGSTGGRGDTLKPVNKQDKYCGFVVKYSPEGEVIWTKSVIDIPNLSILKMGADDMLFAWGGADGAGKIYGISADRTGLWQKKLDNFHIMAIEANNKNELYITAYTNPFTTTKTAQLGDEKITDLGKNHYLIYNLDKEGYAWLHKASAMPENVLKLGGKFYSHFYEQELWPNYIRFNSSGAPQYAIFKALSARVGQTYNGQLYEELNGNMLAIVADSSGKEIFHRQWYGTADNFEMNSRKGTRWNMCFPITRITILGEDTLKPGPSALPLRHELAYAGLNEKGLWRWATIGGGTSAGRKSHIREGKDGKLYVCSDILQYAVLGHDTLLTPKGESTAFYIACIDPDKEEEKILPPAPPKIDSMAIMDSLVRAYRPARPDSLTLKKADTLTLIQADSLMLTQADTLAQMKADSLAKQHRDSLDMVMANIRNMKVFNKRKLFDSLKLSQADTLALLQAYTAALKKADSLAAAQMPIDPMDTITVRKMQYRLSPDPNLGILDLYLHMNKAAQLDLMLMDENGKVLDRCAINAPAGESLHTLDLRPSMPAYFPAGVYLQLQHKGNVYKKLAPLEKPAVPEEKKATPAEKKTPPAGKKPKR